jgi:tetratricopeptide (TPR) repeat protein
MKRSNYLFLFSVLTFSLALSAQTERKITRTGNTHYESGKFVDAEINYKKALEQNANLLEAQFNLGDALAKQDRFEEALASFDLVSSTSEDEQLKANAFHNKGNVQLQQQDLEGAIESYKEALRTNPKDHQTRYNYAYAKKQLEQQQEQEQEQEQDQEQNQEQDQEQQENQNSDDNDNQNKEDAENGEQDDSEQDQQDQQDQGDTKEDETQENDQNSGETDGEETKDEQEEKQGEAKENKLSPEEAQRLLEALKQEENKVQAKMKKHKIKGSKVKIEKDW